MSLLSQSTYTLKRVAREGYSASLTPETIALPANSLGEVQDYANAKAKVKLTYDGKEIFPVYDERLDSEIYIPNLFNKETVTRGSYLLDTGLTTALASWSISDFIEVVSGYQYIASGYTNLGTAPSTCFYDESKNYISGIKNSNANGPIENDLRRAVFIPDGCKYMRFSVQVSDIETLFIEKAVVGVLTTQNCTASIDANGEVSVTNLTADAGYVDIPIGYSQFNTVKRLTLAKSKQGRSIVSSSYEYAQSTSATTAPTTGWVTTPPAWIDGRYIWVRTKITYSEGSPVTTDPVNLTGAGGAVGTGIDSITTEFYLSTSKTTQTGGSWETARPAWVNGKYLWTRLKIVYKNPASTVYTTPVVSSEWEAVNDLRTELVLDYTTKLDVLEDQIQANVTETTSVKNSVTGLTTRVSEAEASLTIQSGQISSKVAKTDYDANNVAVNQQISLIQQKSNQIDIKVGRMRTGAKNLLRNYDMRIPNMKYWSAGATLVTESGTPSQQLTVVSVVQPSSITVAQGGAVYPPSEIVLNISDGSTRIVGVLWGSYSSSTVGSYAISGTYNLPSGITGNKPTVSFTLIVGTAALTIASVVKPSNISVVQNGTPELPTTVTLNISDGTVRTVNVTWGNYSTTTTGTQTISGTYSLPSGVTGSKPPVSLTLTVLAQITVLSVVQPNDVTITAGDNYIPPVNVTLNLSSGASQQVAVTWSFYDTTTPGNYVMNGTYNLPSGVTGSKPSVSFTLVVSAQPVAITVVSVVQPAAISVEQGESVSLPSSITLNLSNGTTRTVAVAWGEHSSATPGSFTIYGTYDLPSDVTGNKPSVSIALTVSAPLSIVGYLIRPDNFTDYEGYSLSTWMSDYNSITFILSDGTMRDISVTWATDYTTSSPAGTYYINAVYTLPADITGDLYPVIVTMTILSRAINFIPALVSLGFTAGNDTNGDYVEGSSTTAVVLDDYIESWLASETESYSVFIKIRSVSTAYGYVRLKLSNSSTPKDLTFGTSATLKKTEVKSSTFTLDWIELMTYKVNTRVYGFEIRKTSNPPSWYV